MSEISTSQATPLLLTSQCTVSNENKDKSTTSSARRPRNREVRSRYKSNITQVSPNRSYLNASGAGGNVSNTLDVTSPKWSKASEKLHHSPSHFSDAKIRSGHCDASMNITSGMRVLPMRMNACTELLWPASDRRAFTSMQHEAYPQALYAMHKKNASGDQESGSPEDQPLRPTLNTVKRRFREPKITTLQFQNSDQSENTQPFDGPCKSNVNRWSGWNLKMRGSEALSRSVDASFSRGRQKDSMATPMMVESKAIFGSSRTPRSMSLSRAGSFPKLKGQGCARGFQKEKTEVKRENGFPHEISITSKDGQTNANVNESQALSREMEAAMSSTFSDIFTTESLESAINSPLNIIADSVCNDATVENMEVTHVRGTKVPARFWKDAMNCSARGVQKGNVHSSLLDTELTLASSRRIAVRSCRPMSPGTYSECSMSSTDAPSPPWMTLVIPQQPSSLPKTSIFSRSTPSPGRSRAPLPSMLMQGQRSSNAAVSLNFGSDILKRGRKALMQIDAVPLFRILHNRLLQWRFINAKAEAGIEAQLLEAQVFEPL
ncbi:hypothetical protein KP509_26G026100 [Ceratopteris richardii]|uniref:Uncharacterized protein n=1 Tax=Ceratopteris richardii TaxID=49495 RepID=A0A8T2RKJ3_CERRI|nr:hypothetical protein KP509_26G026100 [Ceratopteris richardii]